MPSPSADSKFGLSIPKIFKCTQFFNHTQNVYGILKSVIKIYLNLMPSPSADPKNFLSKLKFLKYTQNILSILK